MTRIQERGRARLKMRFPDWRARFERASGEAFLDVCESYELACVGLEHWTKSSAPTRSTMITEYKDVIASLEIEARSLATRAAEEASEPRE